MTRAEELAAFAFREAAARMQSTNNLKQMGLAAHNFHGTHAQLPPMFGPLQGGGNSTALFYLLPYIEQDALYKAAFPDPSATGVRAPVASTV